VVSTSPELLFTTTPELMDLWTSPCLHGCEKFGNWCKVLIWTRDRPQLALGLEGDISWGAMIETRLL